VTPEGKATIKEALLEKRKNGRYLPEQERAMRALVRVHGIIKCGLCADMVEKGSRRRML
jgi:hypothetical protein